jgi:hypothetical protein
LECGGLFTLLALSLEGIFKGPPLLLDNNELTLFNNV